MVATKRTMTSYSVRIHTLSDNFEHVPTGKDLNINAYTPRHALTIALLRNPEYFKLSNYKEYYVIENKNSKHMTYIHQEDMPTLRKTTTSYTLITYDVWGNKEDGFEINQSFSTGKIIDLPDDASDTTIKSMVSKKFGRLGACIIEHIGDDTIQFLQKKDGKPICELQKRD